MVIPDSSKTAGISALMRASFGHGHKLSLVRALQPVSSNKLPLALTRWTICALTWAPLLPALTSKIVMGRSSNEKRLYRYYFLRSSIDAAPDKNSS